MEWYFNEDEATVFPPPVIVINTTVTGQPIVMDTFSEVSINTVGVDHNRAAQICLVLHPEETDPIIEQYFNFTLNSKCVWVAGGLVHTHMLLAIMTCC